MIRRVSLVGGKLRVEFEEDFSDYLTSQPYLGPGDLSLEVEKCVDAIHGEPAIVVKAVVTWREISE
jgi:hypothetical protein